MRSSRLAAKGVGSSRPIAAFATMAGAIIGAGMFGIPYAVSRVGFWLGMLALALVAVGVTYLHQAFAAVAASSPEPERLGFYARKYFGRLAEIVLQLVIVVSRVGILLAYLVAGSHLTASLLGAWFQTGVNVGFPLFLILGALGVWFGRRFVSGVEIPLVVLLVVGVGAIAWFAGPTIAAANFSGWQPKELIVPWGVMLFALAGTPAIPEVRAFVGGPAAFRRIVIAATVFSAFIYAVFAVAVVGVSGPATSAEAVTGLGQALGPQAGFVAIGVGFLAVLTSFFVVGLNLTRVLEYDWGWPRSVSRLAALGAPVILFGAGFNDFIEIVAVVGAVLIATEGLFILAVFERWRGRRAGFSRWGSAAVAGTLVLGAAWYLSKLFRF